MDALFREVGIYAHKGQLYEPVDSKSLLYYHETKDGQILEEGITEAGSMSSFIAAGTAYASHGTHMIPFYIYYSMFGPQRVGDQFWLAGDMKAQGVSCSAPPPGRTTLNGEGIATSGRAFPPARQHQSRRLLAYDPAFAYELAVIIRDGLKRMYQDGEDMSSITCHSTMRTTRCPRCPRGSGGWHPEGVVSIQTADRLDAPLKAHILSSGPIMLQAHACAGSCSHNSTGSPPTSGARRVSRRFVRTRCVVGVTTCFIRPSPRGDPTLRISCRLRDRERSSRSATTSRRWPTRLRPGFPGGLTTLGTDGFGRSDTRERLRRFFRGGC